MVARRTLIIGGLAAVTAPVTGCAGGGAAPGGQAATGAGTVDAFVGAERVAAPEVSGELLDRGTFSLSSLRGSVIVVNFWGSWCAPCRAEAPDLQAAYQATKPLGVSFLGVDIRDGRDAGMAFMAGFGLTYPSLFDPAGRIALAFRDVPPNVVPATILIDREYRVAAVFRRSVVRRELEAAVRALADEDAS
jgi:thiol-disulfide isomerase/thioredoxin